MSSPAARTHRVPRFFRAPPRIPTRAEIDACLHHSDTWAGDHVLVAAPILPTFNEGS